MWALIRDEEDGELRVLEKDKADIQYLNADRRANTHLGAWKLVATNADPIVLVDMARLTDQEERQLGSGVLTFKVRG